MLQHRAGDAKPALGGLIGIGGRTDDDRFAEWNALQVCRERANDLLLDEDAPLECLPPMLAAVIGKFGVGQFSGVVRALDDVAMRVARVAVAATELAPDVRIQRPIVHACGRRRIENPLWGDCDESGAAEAFIEDDGRSGGWAAG